MDRIYYITTEKELKAAEQSREIKPRSLATEGFVHCSFSHQTAAVASRHFKGQQNLFLLEIDPSRLGCKLIEENTSGGAEMYPHIYGPLSLDCVLNIFKFPCRDDGTFEFPKR